MYQQVPTTVRHAGPSTDTYKRPLATWPNALQSNNHGGSFEFDNQSNNHGGSFLSKLWRMLQRHESAISWDETGTMFKVDKVELARDVLSKYFKHNNFASFQRQLR
jgi:hypothetical protein